MARVRADAPSFEAVNAQALAAQAIRLARAAFGLAAGALGVAGTIATVCAFT